MKIRSDHHNVLQTYHQCHFAISCVKIPRGIPENVKAFYRKAREAVRTTEGSGGCVQQQTILWYLGRHHWRRWQALVSEANLALATDCFGQRMNANNGHDGQEIL
ncbi:hypothetical protein ASPWEDRAFT_307689 [Aspergillus wentii DTO 134E9]|uniref:Uncharacterized protein n=1 Tax=Aspergillus wentii DTO 134E9 TaxID=1073089 RepID=A0A1L9RT70_ASPWE|nr:uncharacterized protein ASPWEDRAFT_307689 [Aspergillus wentii DTO 134E9]OJJ38048.1 hypothetical protein ASPWEDRAFT_307689 [Aspergillus wentii DTO 134E9]